MSSVIGTVASIDGKFYAKAQDGSLREVSHGDAIYEGEVVLGDKNNGAIDSVIVTLDNGTDIVILGSEAQLFDASLFDVEFAENETVSESESIEKMFSELNSNVDAEQTANDDIDDVEDIDTESGTQEVTSTEGGEARFAQTTGSSVDINAEVRGEDESDNYERSLGSILGTETPVYVNSAATRYVADLLTAANNAAATANDAIAAANAAVDTLEANDNPTAADIATAQNAIDAADAAIATAATAATAYSDAASSAGEAVEATTAVGSTDAAQADLTAAVNAEIDSDADVADLLTAANNAAATANDAIAAANAAVDTLEANDNPSDADKTDAQDAIDAADAAIATASKAADMYSDAAKAAGETVEATTELKSTDSAQNDLDAALTALDINNNDVINMSSGNNKTAYGEDGDDIINMGHNGKNQEAYGGDDNDTINIDGNNFKAYGEAGDDTFNISSDDFESEKSDKPDKSDKSDQEETEETEGNDFEGSAALIDGGEGLDSLVISDDMDIDMSALDDNISNIERIDLDTGSQNIISLSTEDVLDMTDTDNILRIDGDSSDSIDLNTIGEDAEWTLGDFKTDTETAATYQEVTGTTDDGTQVTLEINTDVQIDQS